MSCHILAMGWPICGFSVDKPSEWKKGENWVGINDPHWEQHASCPDCIFIMKAPDPAEARKWLAERQSMNALVEQQSVYIKMGIEQERAKVIAWLKRHLEMDHVKDNEDVTNCMVALLSEIRGEAHWKESRDG